MTLKLLLIGGTGLVGRLAADRLLADGVTVEALLRIRAAIGLVDTSIKTDLDCRPKSILHLQHTQKPAAPSHSGQMFTNSEICAGSANCDRDWL